jgi:hypothetical protein
MGARSPGGLGLGLGLGLGPGACTPAVRSRAQQAARDIASGLLPKPDH